MKDVQKHRSTIETLVPIELIYPVDHEPNALVRVGILENYVVARYGRKFHILTAGVKDREFHVRACTALVKIFSNCSLPTRDTHPDRPTPL